MSYTRMHRTMSLDPSSFRQGVFNITGSHSFLPDVSGSCSSEDQQEESPSGAASVLDTGMQSILEDSSFCDFSIGDLLHSKELAAFLGDSFLMENKNKDTESVSHKCDIQEEDEEEEKEKQCLDCDVNESYCVIAEVDEKVLTNERLNPATSSEEKVKDLEKKVLVNNQKKAIGEFKKRFAVRSLSFSDLTTITKTKLNKLSKLQAPSKPKFLDRLFNNVSFSRKSTRKTKNGLVVKTRTSLDPAEEADDESEDCLGKLCSNSDDLGGCLATQRTGSSNSSDSGKGSILESTNDFSTSGCASHIDPDTPSVSGIVKQRLQEFRKIQEASKPPPPPSPNVYRSRTVVRSGGKLLLFPAYSDRTRQHCCALARDEKFSNLVMKKGFVKALVEQINQNDDNPPVTSGTDGSKPSVKDLLQRFEKSNCLSPKVSDEVQKQLKNKHKPHTPQGSPRLKRDKNVTSLDYPDPGGRDSLKSSECSGIYSDTLSSIGAHTEGESGIVSDSSTVGFSSVNVLELFDSSWSDSEMSFDEYSDWDSDSDDQENCEEPESDKFCGDAVEIRLHKIADELLKTERAYVQRLHLLEKIFRNRIVTENKNSQFMPAEVINQMFSSITSIYQFHNDFLLPQLEIRMKNWESERKIGDLMKQNAPFLKLYTEYVKNFDSAMNLINSWQEKSSKFASIINEIQCLPECGKLTLQHHMLEPIQRVPRYQLLLQDYIKHLPEDSPDKSDAQVAFELVTKAASHSNEAMKKIEKFNKLLQINEKFGQALDLISPTRELVREGRIIKISARGGERLDRYIFLFNDLMLVCAELLLGSFKIKAQLDMEGLEIMARNDKCLRWILEGENIDIPNTFYVKSRQKIIQFLDEGPNGENLGWCESMKNVIKDYRLKIQTRRQNSNEAFRDSGFPELEVGKLAPKWIKDDEVTMCMLCNNTFTAFRRRHHCRACGIVICGKCSGKKAQLAYDNNRFNRVCDRCYSILNGGEEDFNEQTQTSSQKKKSIKERKASEPAILAGYVQMSTDKCKSFQRRWCSVDDDYVLYVYKAPQDGKALCTVPLPGYTVSDIADVNTNCDKTKSFRLFHKQHSEIYHFSVDNGNQRDRWLDTFDKATKLELPEKGDNRVSTESSGSSNSAS